MPWLDTIAVENIVVEGTQSLTLDLTGTGSVDVHIDLQKTSGSLTIIADKKICMKGKQPGSLILLGKGQFTTCGDLELGSGLDTSGLEGSFIPGTGLLIVRKFYRDHFYVGRLHVQSNKMPIGVSVANTEVIQNAARI